jgi:hypothetical protein
MSFADHPKTVSELRSEKSGDASDWTARDLLVHLLREIDSGTLVPGDMVVIFDSTEGLGYQAAAKDAITVVGLIETVKVKYLVC